MSLHHKWTSHLKTPDEKAKFKRALFVELIAIERLSAILSEFISEVDKNDLSMEEYDKPGFPYLKADRNGEKRAYLKIKQLLDSTKE